jgi:DNA-binding NtrC family response regulator
MIILQNRYNDEDSAIADFRFKKAKHKAQRIFSVLGAKSPADVIEYLREDMGKKASNYETNHGMPTYDNETCRYPSMPNITEKCETLEICQHAIDNGNPKEKAREEAAERLNVDERTIYNRLQKLNTEEPFNEKENL